METVFEVLNNWGGVAIGEHIGQILTLLWVGCIVVLQVRSDRRLVQTAAAIGCLTVIAMGFGLGDGLMVALDNAGAIFTISTIIGYLALSVWLVLTGITMFITEPERSH